MLVIASILWFLLILLGIVWCVAPILPGPQLAYLGILVFHFMTGRPFSTSFLIIGLIVMIVIVTIDQFLPVLATKKFWWSSKGTWWAGIWTVVGVFWWLWGIIFFPFLGALLGEYFENKDWKKSIKPAIGSFIGIAVGGLIKIGICIILWWNLLMMLIQLA